MMIYINLFSKDLKDCLTGQILPLKQLYLFFFPVLIACPNQPLDGPALRQLIVSSLLQSSLRPRSIPRKSLVFDLLLSLTFVSQLLLHPTILIQSLMIIYPQNRSLLSLLQLQRSRLRHPILILMGCYRVSLISRISLILQLLRDILLLGMNERGEV